MLKKYNVMLLDHAGTLHTLCWKGKMAFCKRTAKKHLEDCKKLKHFQDEYVDMFIEEHNV